MEKQKWYPIAIIFVVALILTGAGYFGWSGPADEPQSADLASQKEAMPQSDQATLSGTINETSQLVDDQGHTYELGNSDQGLELKALTGRRVEVTGTVMEDNGQSIVKVEHYEILE